MLLGALIDAGADLKEIQRILDLIPTHFPRCKSIKLSSSEVKKHGFRSCSAGLTIVEEAGETRAQTLIKATAEIGRAANLSPAAESFANNAIHLLAEVESVLHGVDLSMAHLHEAGSADTLADILGTAAACDSLHLFDGQIYCYPLAVGSGTVSFSHGTVPVPVPAVLEIARRYHIPLTTGPVGEELATPTGVSMIASLTNVFVETPPSFVAEKVGYGAGSKELKDAPNVLRIIIGQSVEQRFDRDVVDIVETNLDDVSGEIVGGSLQAILDAGAKDVWVTAAQFKKNRPGYILHALCAPDDVERISQVVMTSTGTLGVRYRRWDRFVLPREVVALKLQVGGDVFDVRVKVARDRSGKIMRIKPEFDDVDLVARKTSRPVPEISALVVEEARKTFRDGDGA